MEELEAYSLWSVLSGIVTVVLVYYAGTRGVLLLTGRYAGRWWRRALVSLSFACLFAPSVAGVGHGGVMPAPAWLVAYVYATENGWVGVLEWGLSPILITWGVFFAIASIEAQMSKNKKNKADKHGKEP